MEVSLASAQDTFPISPQAGAGLRMRWTSSWESPTRTRSKQAQQLDLLTLTWAEQVSSALY